MLLVTACASTGSRGASELAPPVESTTLGAGDMILLEIVGEKNLPREYTVASDGTIDVPYIHSVNVTGLEPQEVARIVVSRLKEDEILTNPSVVVSVKAYNSKRISVLGEVHKPGNFPLEPGMTLVHAISLAGGFNPIANKSKINLSRRTSQGSQTVTVDVSAITNGEAQDVLLQAGDRVYVHERMF